MQHLRVLIDAAAPGTALPSVRMLMKRLAVSPGTVRAAFAQLAAEGVLDARPGRGTFVALQREVETTSDLTWQSATLGATRAPSGALSNLLSVPPPGFVALSTGYLPEELQCTRELTAAAQRAIRRPGVWQRDAAMGLEPLRRWFTQENGAGFRGYEAVICSGTQAALAAAFRSLTMPGDTVALESPTYLGAIAAAQAAGLRLVPVPTDAQGVNPTVLEEILQRSKAKLFYCQPTYSNPTGAVLSEDRRAALLDVVRRAGAFLIEDDWAHDLAFDKPPPPLATLDTQGHVIYVRSLTKSASPSLRVGVLCARGAAFERLCGTRIIEDLYVSSLLQETALQLVTSPAWNRHLRQLRANLVERRDALVSAVTKYFGPSSIPLVPTGGLHLWIKLPGGISDIDLVSEAASAHIAIMPGRDSFPAEHTGEYVRLTFAGARPAVLESAVAKLGRCLARLSSRES